MNETVRVGSRLAVICAVAAVTLGLVNAVTAPRIDAVKKRQLADALRAVSLEFTAGDETPVTDHPVVEAAYPLLGRGGERGGTILRLRGSGYGGEMVLLAAYETSGKLLAAKLTENTETPGLGKKAEDGAYMAKFIGTGGSRPVPTTKQELPQAHADEVTGATMTFVGVGQALEAGSEYVVARAGR